MAGGTRKAWIAALSCALALLAAEIALRVRAHAANREGFTAAYSSPRPERPSGRVALVDILRPSADERIVYELRPNLRGVPFKGMSVTTDSRGFRSAEHPLEKGDALVIVGLGDSLMFGHGVADGEPYLSVLERKLRERHPEREWRVINTAVPGYDTAIEVATLRDKALAFRPDLVIIDFVQNDLELPVFLRDEVDVLDPRHSFLLDLARETLGHPPRGELLRPARGLVVTPEGLSADLDAEGADLRGFPERYRKLMGWTGFRRALDELAALQRENGFELCAFTLCEFSDPVPQMLAEARQRGIRTVSMLEDLQSWMTAYSGETLSAESVASSPLAVEPENAHPSAMLHDLAADKLLGDLESSGLLERLESRR